MLKILAYAVTTLTVALFGFGCESSQPASPGPGGGLTCQTGQALCDGACVALDSNAAHCGGCNNACPSGTSCSGGACTCQAGLSSCGAQCVELTSDPANCGGCGVACAATDVCSLSACAATCADGLSQCGQSCVDHNTSVLHCGACNNACPGGRLCQNGACACERSTDTDCGGVCVDAQADPANCGGCGNACPAGGTCSAGACVGGDGTGGLGNTAGSNSTTGGTSSGFINERGRVEAADNAFGIQGDWYAYGDGVTSDRMGNPYIDGAYCIKGEAPGDEDFSAHWGAGIGLDLNSVDGTKMPYEFEGKVNGFRMTLVGSAPTTPRVHFVNNLDNDVTPFTTVTLDSTETYWIAEARVPLEWGVDNAGERVENGALYSIQILAPGAEAAGPIDVCLTEFEPIYDPTYTGPVIDDGPFINSDGLVQLENNDYGIQGPVYAIGDGNSTTQSGNPYKDGKYCVAGEFSGAESDWGAGIAFDLNKALASDKQPYDPTGKIAGFRIGLSGTSPGLARVQFITDEPQEGTQPFLRALLNTTMGYRVDWAQVPTSWDVSNAGQEVDGAFYSVQVYLEGDQPGPFEVCIDDFAPVTESEIMQEPQASVAGFTGPLTVDAGILAQEYARWKANHFMDCGDGTACVPTGNNDCISEGIGYGMLLAVGYDDQSAFDMLWAYFKKHENANGVMDWSTTACGAANGSGSATDGELDAAMALVQAGCKWGGTYESEALTLISAIRNSEVAVCNNNTVLKPGDSFGGCDETNPSYVAPAYYKVFQTLTGDSTWGDLVDDGYALLSTLQGKMGGLVPDWCDADGNPQSGDRGEYGPDASRTPWRVATDYVWNNEARAITFLDGFANYLESNGGVQRAFTPNSNYRGAAAMSGWPAGGVSAQEFTDAWLTTAVDDNNYFQGTLRVVYLLLAAQQFQPGCS